MKVHTTAFKEQIKEMGRELDSVVTFDGTVLGNEELNAVTPLVQSGLLKSSMKQLEIDSNVEIPVGTLLNYKFGVKVKEDVVVDYRENYEYVDFGNYIVYEVEKQEDTNSFLITCYDKLLYSMIEYTGLSIEYPITIRDYLKAICQGIGLEFENENDDFPNCDKMIEKELFLNESGGNIGYTYRDILDQLAEVTASIICLNKNDKVEIRYPNDTGDTINEEYLRNVNVKFGEKYGPINTIVLSRAGESDNIFKEDEESVELNGRCELKIVENQIMNFNDRDTYLPDILEKLKGLEFYLNDFESTGIVYYEVYDKYNIQIGDMIYNCIMFNDEITITQGLRETIFTELPEGSVTDYTKADKTDRKINQTYIIADKQKGEIEALTNRVEVVEDNAGNSYTKEETNQLIQNAQSGLTNKFSEAGGNNIFRNTGLWFKNVESDKDVNPYEFWQGIAKQGENNKSSNGKTILLQKGKFIQDQEVSNGIYSVSFYYQKLLPLATATVTINNNTYNLDSETLTQFYTGKTDNETGEYITLPVEVGANHITITFETDTDDSVELFDLMANKGEVKLAYSQNQNETVTDTVNISKGITITSSAEEVKFQANADGIKTLDKNDNILTEFTDKGMTTNEATIKNQATVVGILRQRVENQIWDSFIG